jgi:signal transduction histidine kinase
VGHRHARRERPALRAARFPEKLRFLFERQAGTQHAIGLALTLVKDIVTAHGGSVIVESSTDVHTHGTTVHVTLPTE